MDNIAGTRINANFYVRSAPKAPLDPGTAEFVKGKPAISQPAKDWNYYETALTKLDENRGRLLKEYKESGAWKAHYKSWKAACEPLRISKRHADRLIEEEESGTECPTFDKADTLAKVIELPDPLAEIDARMEEALKAKATPKSKLLENGESEEDYEKPRVVTHEVPEEPKDMDGTVIPKKLLSVWNRRDEVQSAMTLASKLRTLIKDLAGQSSEKGGKTDPLYSGMGWQAAITALNSIYYQFSECRPDVVCPLCQGSLKDPRFDNDRECPNCRHLGFVSERRRTEWVNGAKGRKASETFVERKK